MKLLTFTLLGLVLGTAAATATHHVPATATTATDCPECGPIPPLCNPNDPDCH